MIPSGAAKLSLLSTSRSIRRVDARFISKLSKGKQQPLFQRTALDSHADTSCAGSNATAIELTGEKVNVYPFSDDLPSVREVPIATALTIWESPSTGEVWGLVLHETLYFGDRLQGSLLCPNQVRAAGHRVYDVPVQFDPTSKHSKKRDRIIKKVKARYWERAHKYGIPLPKSVAEALRMDRETGTDFWQRAIEKEMKNVECALEFPADGKAPVGYQKIDCHMIFDVKMTLERKARFVAGGHQTAPPKDITFASVVSRDSIRIAFLVAALNDLEILSRYQRCVSQCERSGESLHHSREGVWC